jgi:hypothetical protein
MGHFQNFVRIVIFAYDATELDGDFMLSVDMEFENFFKKLGYKVTYDFLSSSGEIWWEIYSDNGLICQIDKGIPLDIIIEDLNQIKNGLEKWESRHPVDYKINAPDSKEFTELLSKI